jgi:hypothetical protein
MEAKFYFIGEAHSRIPARPDNESHIKNGSTVI